MFWPQSLSDSIPALLGIAPSAATEQLKTAHEHNTPAIYMHVSESNKSPGAPFADMD